MNRWWKSSIKRWSRSKIIFSIHHSSNEKWHCVHEEIHILTGYFMRLHQEATSILKKWSLCRSVTSCISLSVRLRLAAGRPEITYTQGQNNRLLQHQKCIYSLVGKKKKRLGSELLSSVMSLSAREWLFFSHLALQKISGAQSLPHQMCSSQDWQVWFPVATRKDA